MRAFIVRPFGVKEDIDFDRVERELIAPALERHGIAGRTTGEISRQGNIREDMFRLLVTADLVIADVSIHNANAFYELGIRHGLQERHTFLIRTEASRDKYPFDLQTDRYFLYDRADPGARLEDLVAALRSTLASSGKDSPVFQLLPKLKPHDRSTLMVVPWDFQEEVARARATARRGDLRLLADEAQSFEWGVEGLRVVGEAQFQIGAFTGARETFEAMRRAVPDDFLANFRLGTIYQRLARSAATSDAMLDLLVRSDQAIARVLERTRPPAEGGEAPAERSERRFYRAEAHSLLGSNAKTRWMDEWQSAIGEARRVEALRAPGLGESLQHYLNGYAEDLDSYYPGINALALLKIQIELAKSLPEVWAEGFDDDMKAAADLEQRGRRALRTAAALELALGIDEAVATSEQSKPDIWKAISAADLLFLTVERPQRIGNAYRKALADAQPFEVEAVRRNILLFKDLALLTPNVEAALGAMQQGLVAKAASVDQRPARVVLFTGHMIDAPGRPKDKARFPPTPEAERTARGLIEEALRVELQEADGTLLGMAGGACGSDILFHEICESLGIGTRLFLALPEEEFLVTSVSRGGPDWVERYRRLCSRVPPRVLADSKDLPRWLADRRDYDIWQRNNLWMMFNALAEEARNLTLIALYNPEREPDGPGGTRHLIEVASKWGFKPVALDARALLKS